ncbi:tRNA (adenosine(37)-N6)-threonylcarbamoyltransferase complex dimerization subunit type 1 TsaB [Catenovulum sediminis]|uniref:tRNA (adenosine(37)-N6)-threonylcarbamoyltransferase complex dimerization subunit type 1 TsaB n=1 Tax=Catenovulum sediminis TaxID=1740262 RepID=UPI00117CBE16|nr:tRNA (adenosine(37)-N6)-threonylcarbamoyltransferase complex dimerization subunit type 1 TsaB [Catenovulum sediminis]
MTRILALDTSTEACSAAVIADGKTFVEFDVCPREHNKRILAMTDSVLTQANLKLADVDVIAYGQGPGSFTGVRIATGIVQGLALGADKATVGVSSLQAMAHSIFRTSGQTHIISAIDARMNEIYLGAFIIEEQGSVQTVIQDTVCDARNSLKALDSQIVWQAIGTGWQTYHAELSQQINAQVSTQCTFPNALDIALIGLKKFSEGDQQSAAQVSPVYVRDQVTWKKLPGK